MRDVSPLANRLTRASRKEMWNPHTAFNWTETLQPGAWCMPPELISIYGTDAWASLSEEQQKRLSLYELGNFFSLVLQGERPLVQGLVHRFYGKNTGTPVTEYLHHFVDEENKHMIMFGEFCKRYIGKVYPEKKISLQREFAKGEEDVAFYCKAMVVEEYGDFYNVAIMTDERCDPLVREINRVHQLDETRHLTFGRSYLAALFEKHKADWSPETLAGFQEWLTAYMKASWSDYYNPTAYQDAGLADGYELRQVALSHPACRERRTRASARLVRFFIQNGMLAEAPAF